MPLRVTRRKSSGALTITGTIELPDGSKRRIRRRAQSDDYQLAREEAAIREAETIRTAWLGERRGTRTFAEAVLNFLKRETRSDARKDLLNILVREIGTKSLAAIDQDTLEALREKLLRPQSKGVTFARQIVGPVAAVLREANKKGWCNPPDFERPEEPEGRPNYLLPAEAERLVEAAAPHLRPLLVFLIGTGARMSEALELAWRDVDLVGARVRFWRTKSGKRRDAMLPPRVVVALANLDARDGPVFRWRTKARRDGSAKRVAVYADHGRRYGGQIKTAFRGAVRRAGLNRFDPALTPHDLRHTWASWHYALDKDLLRLKVEGGWSTVLLVERYAHLLPAGQEAAIRAFLGHHAGTVSAASDSTA